MENNMIKRMLPFMIGAVLIVTGVVVATILLGGSKGTPWGSVSNNAYYTYNGTTISEREWYDKARYNSYSYFIDMIDSKLINVDELIEEAKSIDYVDQYDSDVTNLYLKFHQDIVFEYMYGTNDRGQIAYMSDVDKQQSELEYYNNLRLVGIDTNDYWDKAVKDRYLIAVAKRMYTLNYFKDLYTSEDSSEEDYITETKAQEYWADSIRYDGTVNAIVITFNSISEYNDALNTLEVCQAGNKFYDKPTDGSKCNTSTQLTYDEVKELFVDLYVLVNYNYNGIKAPTTDGIEYSTYDLNQIDSEISRDVFQNLLLNPVTDLGEDDDDIVQYYTSRTTTSGTLYAAVKMTDVVPYVNYDDYDAIIEQMSLDQISASYTESIFSDLRNDSDIIIYDPVLESYYKFNNTNFKTSSKESDDNIASVNGKVISVDEFYAYIEDSLAVIVSNDLMATKVAKQAVPDSVSKDDKDKTKDSVKDTVSQFKRGSLNSYGYDNTAYDESVFLATFYNATSLDDAIEKEIAKLYVNNFYTDYDVIYGETFYDDIYDYVMKQYEQYFKFDANEFIIYVDINKDGTADDFQEAINEGYVTKTDAADFANDLMNTVYISQTTDISFADALSNVVDNYNSINVVTGKDKTGNVNSLYEYYKDGFRISTSSSTTYTSTTGYSSLDGNVYQGLLGIYNTAMENEYWNDFDENGLDDNQTKFITSGNNNGPAPDFGTAVYDDLIVSEAGIHLYIVGNGYEKPEFHATDDNKFNLTVEDLEYVLTNDDAETDCEADEDVDNECIDEDEYDLIYEFYSNVSTRLSNTYQRQLSLFKYIDGAVYANAEQLANHNNRIIIYQQLVDNYDDFPTSDDGLFTNWFDVFSVNPVV